MKKIFQLIVVSLLLSSCQSDETKFQNSKAQFENAWLSLYEELPFETTVIYEVEKLKEEKPFLTKALNELNAIDGDKLPLETSVEFFAIKKMIKERIDFLEKTIKIDPTVFSVKQSLEDAINEKGRETEKVSKDVLTMLEKIPNRFAFAKSIIKNPELAKIELALEEEKGTYFFLKNQLPKWFKENATTTLAFNHFSKKNETAQLAIKDWIAFLNSAKFEIGDEKGEWKSD